MPPHTTTATVSTLTFILGSSGFHDNHLQVDIIGVKNVKKRKKRHAIMHIEGGSQNMYPTILLPPHTHTSSTPNNHATICDEIDTCTISGDLVHRPTRVETHHFVILREFKGTHTHIAINNPPSAYHSIV